MVIGTLALSLATFMNVLDTSIANVSIPAISGDLAVSPNQGTWVITSFAVANAVAVPLTGWLTQRFGQVRLFLGSVALFSLMSLLCGLAPNMESLILFRVLQGFVAGPMMPLSQTLLLSTYPPHRSGAALSFSAMTTLVAPVVGPLAGGWITDNIGWPWIFYINVPVGIIASIATWSVYHKRETPTRKVPIDAIGLTLLILGVGALQLMLDKGKDLDWFNSPQIIALAVIAVVGLSFFVVWELTDAHPVVDLRLFKQRNFLVATLSIAIAYSAFFGALVLLPLWLQMYMGYTATQAGWALAPVGLLAILVTPIVGRYINRVDPRPIVTASFLIFALVMFMRSQFTSDADLTSIMIPTIIQGAGVATFFLPLFTIALGGIPPERIASASGLMNFARIVAGAFGTSLTTTLWDRRAALHHSQLVEHLVPGQLPMDRFLELTSSAGMPREQALAALNRSVDVQAFTLAADELFYGCIFIFLVLSLVIWATRRQTGAAARDPGAGTGAH